MGPNQNIIPSFKDLNCLRHQGRTPSSQARNEEAGAPLDTAMTPRPSHQPGGLLEHYKKASKLPSTLQSGRSSKATNVGGKHDTTLVGGPHYQKLPVSSTPSSQAHDTPSLTHMPNPMLPSQYLAAPFKVPPSAPPPEPFSLSISDDPLFSSASHPASFSTHNHGLDFPWNTGYHLYDLETPLSNLKSKPPMQQSKTIPPLTSHIGHYLSSNNELATESNTRGAGFVDFPFQNTFSQSYALPSGEEPTENKMEIDCDTRSHSDDSSEDQEQTERNAALIDAALEDLDPLQERIYDWWGRERTCAGCRTHLPRDTRDTKKIGGMIAWVVESWVNIAHLADNALIGKQTVLLGWTCPNTPCRVTTCFGCGETMLPDIGSASCSSSYNPKDKFELKWCCDSGRLAAIWMLACGRPAQICPPSLPTSSTPTPVPSNLRESIKRHYEAPYGGSSSSANAKGVGYGNYSLHDSLFSVGRLGHCHYQMPKATVDTSKDDIHFRMLTILLPKCQQLPMLDILPPDFLSSMLSRSPFLELVATMLGNDCIEEVALRQPKVYEAMLEFCDALASHPATSALVYSDRRIYHEKGGQLLDFSLTTDESLGKIVVKDTGKPLLELLGKLAAQSETILRHAPANYTEFHNADGQKLLTLSHKITDLYDYHVSNRRRNQTEMEVCSAQETTDFASFHRETSVKEVSDEAIAEKYVYSSLLSSEVSSWGVVRPGRMKRLITEISTLRTSLPGGIFIRHGESRLDAMQILIIGPKGTPYEHGMFEFDLHCQPSYPNEPPRVTFKTTNGGRLRFNPNLYEDGKVCLSLLGTWAGETWRPSHSTILQLLVSIQSMVLCEHPYYNEPGFDERPDKLASDRYDAQVREMTMRYALLPWIKATNANGTKEVADAGANANDIAVNPLWKETVWVYLKANSQEILSSLKKAASQSTYIELQSMPNQIDFSLRKSGYLV